MSRATSSARRVVGGLRVVSAGIVLIASLMVGEATSAQAPVPPLPTSMAAIGDSMTQAADVCCWYGDHPSNSWSTGAASWDGVVSHYERIRAINPAISAQNYNDSASGARMSDGPAQAQRAVGQRAQYVTILLGANDLCTATPDTMTTVDAFRTQFRATLAVLAGLSGRARVFVASIPDVYQLWQIFHTDPVAQFVWGAAGICQSLLAPERSDAERLLVQQQNIAFNAVLQQECAVYAWCMFDDNAVFGFKFGTAQVSKLDYFHPSLSGQAALANVTWESSWWH
jgi:lysophospholipase L1-like esterase